MPVQTYNTQPGSVHVTSYPFTQTHGPYTHVHPSPGWGWQSAETWGEGGFQAPSASYDLFPSGAGVVGLGQVWGAVASSSIL